MSVPDPFADMEEWPAGLSTEKPAPKVQPIKANGSEHPAVAPQSPKANAKPLTAFPVTWVQDAKLKLDARPIVKGMIEPGAFIVIYGPSGSGKSFFTADIAQHIATGQPWRGRKVQKGLVVYVASEAGASILKRFVGWRDNRMGESTERIPLAILTRGPDLMNPVQIELLCEQLKQLQEEAGLPLVLVVFDTLSRSMPGADENSTEDMSMAVNVADHIRQRFDAASAYVHHTGKDSTKGPRGAYALYAAADLVLLVQDKVASVEKVRDGLMTEKFPFTLEPVEIGLDADGDPVMTCLLNAADSEAYQEPKKAQIRGIAAIALQAMNEEMGISGRALPGSSTIPAGVKAIKIEQWRERFRIRYGEDKDQAVRTKAFWRAKDQLLSAGAIALSDPWAWSQMVKSNV